MDDELIGRRFGGYELKERVGAGGVASIYKDMHTVAAIEGVEL